METLYMWLEVKDTEILTSVMKKAEQIIYGVWTYLQ